MLMSGGLVPEGLMTMSAYSPSSTNENASKAVAGIWQTDPVTHRAKLHDNAALQAFTRTPAGKSGLRDIASQVVARSTSGALYAYDQT
jgi:hypothetical protein